jgi:glycosyltransferase involved in cell wall biosynthesis
MLHLRLTFVSETGSHMKILVVHNFYQQPGGEDDVFEAEAQLLSKHGHSVATLTRDNEEIGHYGRFEKLAVGVSAIWSARSSRELSLVLREFCPDVVHFHNTFPLLSPAVYYACARFDIPVIQSLHNPRLLCPAATFYRSGKICRDCLGKAFAWPAVLHGCYRDSRVQSTLVASMVAVHRLMGTWFSRVDRYIVFTQFYRDQFRRWGIPDQKIAVKPHFVEIDPGVRQGDGNYLLFLGRLAAEKGVRTLLQAWRNGCNIPLKIRGDGPLRREVQELSQRNPAIQLIPRLNRAEYYELIKGARFLVWPSEGYYETFGRVAIEAFACGVPVLASQSGVGNEIVSADSTGIHFRPGDANDLREKGEYAWAEVAVARSMGRRARAEYERKYSPDRNYRMLMDIYTSVLSTRQGISRGVAVEAAVDPHSPEAGAVEAGRFAPSDV